MLADELKSTARAAREALRAVRDLETELDGDVHGQFLIESDEDQAEYGGELLDYIALARERYPSCELTVIVVAHPD